MKFLNKIVALMLLFVMPINASLVANGTEITQDNVNMHLYSVPVKSNECSKETITVYDFAGKYYLNLDDIKDFTRCTLTEEDDKIILTHGLREIVINKSTGHMTDSDIIDQGTVSLLKYDGKYLCEGIPMLEYLGANCTINEHDELEIFMPVYTIWESIMPDYLDYYFDIGKLYGGKDNVTLSLTLDTLADIFDGVSGHGIFANADTHLEDALYEVLDVDMMKYASVQEIATAQNEKINSFLASTISETVLDTSDNAYDAVYEILDYYSRFYISSKNDILLDMMEKTDNLDRASEIASQIKKQVYTQSAIKTNLNNANKVQGLLDIGMLAFDTSITAFNMMQYNDDTKNIFARTINEDMFDYTNYHDVHWNNVSDRISNSLKNTKSIVVNTAVDNVVNFTVEKVAEKGATKALSAFTSKSSIYATAVQIGLFVASLINYKSNQAFSADMNAIWLSPVQYDVAMLVSHLLLKERDEYKFSSVESLEKLKDMLTLYYRITIAFSENIAKSIDEFGTNNKEKWVSWFSSSTDKSVCNYTAAYLYRITNCTVIPIVDYSSLSDQLLTNEWISKKEEIKNKSLNNDDLEQYLNNMEIPVDIYTYFHHYSDTKKVDINDPYTFWMMLSFYATMQMADDLITSGSKLAERYKDKEQGEMLILSEEEVRDVVNAMMPGITHYPDFPDVKYEKPYKKDGDYYLPLIDLDTEATRMTDIKINDDGTATATVEAFTYYTGEIYETYQINLVKNDKMNLNSPEPYPYCIESIKVASSDQIETESDGIAQAIWTEADTTLTFYYGPQVFVGDTFKGKTVTNAWSGSSVTDSGNESVVWADTVADSVTDVVFDASFWAVKPTSTHGWFQSFYELSRVDMSGLNTSSVTDMSNMFERCFSLTSLDLSGFDTSNVTNMSGMFAGSALTNLDLSSFDTSKVLDMSGMFHICSDLTNLNVSNFNTSKVTNMDSLFLACGNLTTLDVSGFDTSSVTNMREMFAECRELTSLDVGGFDTSSAIVMQGMFRSCSNLLSIDVRGFNTSNVTDMYMMFCGCSSLTNIDLSNFDTSNVITMGAMFDGCSSLTNLDVSSFSTSKVTGMESMFYGCSSLTSLNLNSFDTSNVTEMMHMFGECSSLTSLDLSGFNTFNVDNMYRMFGECDSLTSLDLSGFDVSKVTNIDDMFNSCHSLRTIYCEDSSTVWGLFEYSDNMFFGCESLIGKDGSSEIAFDDLKTDSSMAKAASLGGYFTPK